MPNYDGTGPNGRGPLTGRGLGECQGARGVNRAVRPGYGRGLGYGRGRGLGRGRCPYWNTDQPA